MNCSVLLLHVQFTYEEYGCVLTAKMLADVHMCSCNIIKSRSASKQLPISMDAWVYLYTHALSEQTCLDITDTPFISSTNWKKDRIIHLPVGSALGLPKYGMLTEGRLAGTCVCMRLLPGVSPPHQYFLASCEMKEMHMWRQHPLY